MLSVDILIPFTEDRRELLAKAIKSIGEQTYREFINVGCIKDLGAGIADTRNKLLDNSKADYIFIMDSDDMLEPTCIERLVDEAEKGYDWVFPELVYIDINDNKMEAWGAKLQTLEEMHECKKIPHQSLIHVS